MRIIIISALLTISFSFAQTPSESIVISPLSHNFGVISDKKPVHYWLTVENNSDKILHILKIKIPCSCTIASPHTKKFKPGEKGKIKIIFDPKRREGYLRWEIAVITNLSSKPILINFDSTIRKDDYLSNRIVYFGEFERGEQLEKKIWLSPHKQKKFKIKKAYTQIEGKKNYFSVKWQEGQYDGFYPGPRKGFCLTIVPKKDIPYGRLQGKLVIETDIAGKEIIELDLAAKVVGEIGTSRDYLTMGLLTSKRPIVRRVMVYHRKGDTFRIEKVHCSLPFLETKLENIIPDQYYEIQVTGKASLNAPNGEFRGKLLISTSSEKQPEIVVWIQGFVKK